MSVKFLGAVLGVALIVAVQSAVAYVWGAERVQANVAILTLPVSVWFIVLYSRDPWWKTWFGRSLMLIAVAVTIYTLSTILFRNFGDYPGRDVMLVASADITFAAMLMRTLVLRSAQRDDHRQVAERP